MRGGNRSGPPTDCRLIVIFSPSTTVGIESLIKEGTTVMM